MNTEPTPVAPAPESPKAPDAQKPETVKSPAEKPKPENTKAAHGNPVLAIAIAVFIALVLSGLSLVSFLRSDTRKTILLTQKPSADSAISDLTIDTTSALKSADLDTIQAEALKDLDSLNDTTDFSSNELTDAALGL